jgi:hypothetical protein
MNAPVLFRGELATYRPLGPELAREPMTAGEQMFFFQAPLAHVVQFEDRLRLMRKEGACRRMGQRTPRPPRS